ncbi:MAG: glycerol dehydrogenase [Candidatus Cloacimonadaceae bacterium]|jgi:glycerol dehydrogenase|nr:glycerol dehydrogenase [Candidatus Cloacimonadota bacterium]MDD2544047.1 glycerol dehydrogenase [Candidatus Cloacimonadota bacterium]MDY0337903.1 glycerol dehydrogenase [Candidatus Cloacimonadaceae bacterium]
MMQKALFPGQYLQGAGALYELPLLVKKYGSKALMLASPSVIKGILPGMSKEFASELLVIEQFGGECSQPELSRIFKQVRSSDIDVMIGMGGGKTIDTAKIVADWAGIPVIVVPTIASTDAPCSGCAVTYSPEGVFETVLYQKRNPAVVLVDLNIIAAAPVRFLISGMGDALATWFEARSCECTKSLNECGGHSTRTGLGIAQLCYETLLEYGLQARIANQEGLITPALSNITEANILLSGIGFESCGIACAHAVHNGLTVLEETHAFFHGEKVAFGVLTGLHLNSAQSDEIDEVYNFCKQIGLPTCLADIGLSSDDRERLMRVAEESCKPDSSMHKEAGEITPDMVLNAMLMADAWGKKRKGSYL